MAAGSGVWSMIREFAGNGMRIKRIAEKIGINSPMVDTNSSIKSCTGLTVL